MSLFLSTLSLRRATERECQHLANLRHFYPRSPCGERPYRQGDERANQSISIHALLAESDSSIEEVSKYVVISIHALLAESDRPR